MAEQAPEDVDRQALPGDPPIRETVSGAEILQQEGAGSEDSARELTPTQRAALTLAYGVGLLIIAVVIYTCVQWCMLKPHDPPSSAATKDTIANYVQLRTLSTDETMKFFDDVVARTLLPVFTAILGYLFGTRAFRTNGQD